jgi:hypothetical protein
MEIRCSTRGQAKFIYFEAISGKKNIYGCTPVKKNHLWMRTRSKKKLFMDAHPVQKKIINVRPVLKKSSRAQE